MATEEFLPCPCCGEGLVEEEHLYDVCEICGWEDDPVQFDDPDYRGGANTMSLNEARAAFKSRRNSA